MIFGKSGEVLKEDFTVVDSAGTLVTGLVDGNFTRKLYNPSGTEVSGSITITVSELGNGNYRASFTPDTTGMWYMVIYHATYFPWGKKDSIQVSNSDFDSLSLSINDMTSSLDSMAISIGNIEISMDNVVNAVYDMTSSVDDMVIAVSGMETSVNNMINTINDMTSSINDISITMTGILNSINDMTSSIDNMIVTVNNMDTSVNNMYLTINDMTGSLDYIASEVETANNSLNSLTSSVNDISVLLLRILGLSQENHYLDNTSYDDNGNLVSCRIRLYSNASSVGSSSNVIATYLVTAGYTGELLDYYKVVKQ